MSDRGAALIGEAVRRLTARGLVEPTVHEVLVDHPHRAVLRMVATTGQPVFVKAEVGQARARREAVAIGIASRAGIPVPELLHVELGDVSVLVVAGVDGRPIGAADAPPVWALTARHLVDLHAIEVDDDALEVERFDHREADWVAFMRWWAAHEAEAVVARGMLDQGLVTALLRRTDEVLAHMAAPHRSLLHGDCQADHVYVGRQGQITAILDWGDAATGDPLWDLAVLTARHPRQLETVGVAYGLEPSATVVVRAYWAVRYLGSAVWMADHAYDPTPDLRAATALVT